MKFADLDRRVWRVGFLPQPWEWSDWRWAGPDGRFNGRWDPLDHGLYRTVYAADSLLACLVELLAPHRPDPYLVAEVDDIVEDDSDAEHFPSARPGELDIDQWLVNRVVEQLELLTVRCAGLTVCYSCPGSGRPAHHSVPEQFRLSPVCLTRLSV